MGDSTQRAFENCGFTRLAREYGVALVDTQDDTASRYDCAGLPIEICDAAMAVDFMINLPAVSYTHLDVYKRQILFHEMLD